MASFKQYYYEKTVIGVTEVVVIGGIGKVVAKVDSGNSAFNVLHATDIKKNRNSVKFKTLNNKVVESEAIDSIQVNMGGGNIEERPVVAFTVSIGPYTFNNVKFSLTDRSDNDHPCLLSKDFVGEHLDALIDVTRSKIADKNIQIEL